MEWFLWVVWLVVLHVVLTRIMQGKDEERRKKWENEQKRRKRLRELYPKPAYEERTDTGPQNGS